LLIPLGPSNLLAENLLRDKALSTLETIVADFGENLSPKTATVAGFDDSRRIGDYSRQWATIVASVDRP